MVNTISSAFYAFLCIYHVEFKVSLVPKPLVRVVQCVLHSSGTKLTRVKAGILVPLY